MLNLKEQFIQAKTIPRGEKDWRGYYYQVFEPLIKRNNLPYDVRYPYPDPDPDTNNLPSFPSWYDVVEYLSTPETPNEALFRYLTLGCYNLTLRSQANPLYHTEKAIEAALIVNGRAILAIFDIIYAPDNFNNPDDRVYAEVTIPLIIASNLGQYRKCDYHLFQKGFGTLNELFTLFNTIKVDDFSLWKFVSRNSSFYSNINLEDIDTMIFLMCFYRRKAFLRLAVDSFPIIDESNNSEISVEIQEKLIWYPCLLEDMNLAEYIVGLLRGIVLHPNIQDVWLLTRQEGYVRQFTARQKEIARYMLRSLKLDMRGRYEGEI